MARTKKLTTEEIINKAVAEAVAAALAELAVQQSTVSTKVDAVEFDRKKYLATAKKLAAKGEVRLRKNGAPWKADRPKVYKAMGLSK